MREFLLGVLGAALVYFAAWYRMAPDEAVVAGPDVPKQDDRRRVEEVRAFSGAVAARGGRSDQPLAGTGFEPSPRPAPAEGVMPSQAEAVTLGHQALPAALPKAIEQMSGLQKVAADPDELAARVQTTELSASELAELKAFAEKFVILPPDRTEQRISGSSGRPEPSRIKPP